MPRFWPALLLLAFGATLSTTTVAQSQFENIHKIAAAQGFRITPLAGDYDGDGDMDILGTGSIIRNGYSSDGTVVLRNDGEEFVVLDVSLASFYYGGMYLWADLDNDNDLDIVGGGCTSYCYNSKGMVIYRNDGKDKFTLVTGETGLIGGKSFSFADYNNDSLIDIQIATQGDNNDNVVEYSFYKNVGNFQFEKTFSLPITTGVGEAVWGDLNNDGLKDFVLWDHAYKNLGNETFEPFDAPDGMQVHVRHFIFDADTDGDQDVITSNGIFMENDGNGILSFASVIIPYEYVGQFFAADFTGDGHIDMLVSGGSQYEAHTQLLRSNGDGTYTAEDVNEQYIYSYQLAVADMDDDNDLDIIVSGVFSDQVVVLENGIETMMSKPALPANLQTSISSNNITLSWDAATDNEQGLLSYNLYLTRGDNFVIAPGADLISGDGFLPGWANASTSLQRQVSTSSLPEGYYRWSVQTIDSELNRSPFATPQEFTRYQNNPANAPTDLTLTGVTPHSVSLTWTDHATDETSFSIERSLDGNSGFQVIDEVTANVTSYVDNSVLSNSMYYYRIRLVGSAAVAYSNVIQVETETAISVAPANLVATVMNSASVEISWEYSGTGIEGFVIQKSPDDKTQFADAGSTEATVLTYTDQQLESGRTYYYRLVAVNGEDRSDYSNILKVSVPQKEFNRITLSSLMYENSYVIGGIAWGDYDNDGYDDLFIAYKTQLFHNKGDGSFEQVPIGIVTAPYAMNFVGVWGDYDNDGFLDLYTYNSLDKSSLYRGHGNGTFTKKNTLISSDISEITNATWVDFDMDGDLELSITGGRYFYRYDGDDTFVRVDLPGSAGSYYNSSVASWGDYDDDGDPDVFWGNNGHDEFFDNNGDGTLTAVTDQRATSDYNYDCCPIATPTALWTDFNNDQKLDLTVFHASSPIYAYANHENKLDSVFSSYEYDREGWKNMFWTDFDSDGDLDFFVMGQYNAATGIWENKEDRPFSLLKGGPLYKNVSTDAGFSWNDYDNDGYSDLFQFDEDHTVWKNISNGNHWIKVRLKGRVSNSSGLGAKVFVKANGTWQRSDVTTHHSYRVQQGFMSLFGLGKATHVDSVKVLWPSGYRQYLLDVDIDQVIVLDENDAQEKFPQAPSNLVAEVVFPSSTTLRWTDRSDSETGFIIEKAIGEEAFVEVGSVGANFTSFSAGGLSDGVKYKFRVKASGLSTNRTSNVAVAQIALFTEVLGGDLTAHYSKTASMSWGDPDDDGDPDLFAASEWYEKDAVYYNSDGDFTRDELTEDGRYHYSRQAQWVDYDNDGHLDLHVSVGSGAENLNDFLYKNDGTGLLVDQTNNSLAHDAATDNSAAWGDLNRDGFPEMIVGRYTEQSPLFLNLGGNLAQSQQQNQEFRPQGMLVLSDIDNDRDLDLISSDNNSYQTSIFTNTNGEFRALPDHGITYTASSFVVEDFDNDGDFDILMVSNSLKLYIHDAATGKFSEKMNAFPGTGYITSISTGDFDNNGFVDVVAAVHTSLPASGNGIFLNQGNLTFTSFADPFLERHILGTAVADFNKDGHLDLFAATDNDYYQKRNLLRGSNNANYWVRVKPRGVESNIFALGAKVKLFIGDMILVREIRSSAGGIFLDEQIAHFGLGLINTVDYLKIEWPNGDDQWISHPTLLTELTIEQAITPAPPGPSAPSNLVAALTSDKYIELNWSDNSDNEKSFRVERAVGSGNFVFFRSVDANKTSYTDSTFADSPLNGLQVKYRVVARRLDAVDSDPSNEASVSLITGIEAGPSGLVLYPQPASSKAYLRSDETIHSIAIVGMRGETVGKISTINSRETEIPLHNVAPGVYVLRITSESGTRTMKLLVGSEN